MGGTLPQPLQQLQCTACLMCLHSWISQTPIACHSNDSPWAQTSMVRCSLAQQPLSVRSKLPGVRPQAQGQGEACQPGRQLPWAGAGVGCGEERLQRQRHLVRQQEEGLVGVQGLQGALRGQGAGTGPAGDGLPCMPQGSTWQACNEYWGSLSRAGGTRALLHSFVSFVGSLWLGFVTYGAEEVFTSLSQKGAVMHIVDVLVSEKKWWFLSPW